MPIEYDNRSVGRMADIFTFDRERIGSIPESIKLAQVAAMGFANMLHLNDAKASMIKIWFDF